MTYTMIIADDHPLMRAGISTVMSHHPQYKIIAEASNGEELIAMLKKQLVDVILLDARMPGLRVNDIVAQIKNNCRQCRIVILSAFDDAGIVKSLIDQGVDAYILKDEMQDVVVEALETVLVKNERWMSERIKERYHSASNEDGVGRVLSEREWHVVQLLSEGLSNKDIATQLNVTKSTVSYHVSNILEKLQLSSRLEVALWAQQQRVDQG